MRSRSLRLDACLRSTRSGVADLGQDMWGFTNVPVRTVSCVKNMAKILDNVAQVSRSENSAAASLRRVHRTLPQVPPVTKASDGSYGSPPSAPDV